MKTIKWAGTPPEVEIAVQRPKTRKQVGDNKKKGRKSSRKKRDEG